MFFLLGSQFQPRQVVGVFVFFPEPPFSHPDWVPHELGNLAFPPMRPDCGGAFGQPALQRDGGRGTWGGGEGF